MSQPNEAPAAGGTRAADLFRRLLQTFSAVEYLELRPDGTIACVNDAFARHFGVPASQLEGRDVGALLVEPNAGLVKAWAAGAEPPAEPHLLNFVDARDQPYTLRCVAARDDGRLILIGESDAEGQRVTAERLLELNNEFATMTRELTRRTRELEQTRRELERARDEIRELRGGTAES
ncbi:MAG: PAS domain-containing protein [Candidatus Cloacimonetes bacterium]|nr:PAS domain-containing protein [Candidatus Cloacimonadota bacterium]